MEPQVDHPVFEKDVNQDPRQVAPAAAEQSGAQATSPNESPVQLDFPGLAPHVRVVRPSRPSLTYERVE